MSTICHRSRICFLRATCTMHHAPCTEYFAEHVNLQSSRFFLDDHQLANFPFEAPTSDLISDLIHVLASLESPKFTLMLCLLLHALESNVQLCKRNWRTWWS